MGPLGLGTGLDTQLWALAPSPLQGLPAWFPHHVRRRHPGPSRGPPPRLLFRAALTDRVQMFSLLAPNVALSIESLLGSFI